MEIELDSRPSYGMAVVTMAKGEKLIAESGAMVAMSTGVAVDTNFNGVGKSGIVGFIKAALTGLARKFLAGESMFVNHFRAKEDGQQVMLAPSLVGDVVDVPMEEGRAVTVQASSYLASTPDVDVELVWGGLSMLFSGEGAFFLKCRGKAGNLLINAYGAIEKLEVNGKYVVDSGHVVAFEGDLKYKIKRVGGWKASLLSGEGLVLEFEGDGTLWLQSRNLGSFVSWITPFLP
ncbi:MAG: TIGR00266 family protein [Proteobacteria bacterium]|nr:TIGR00266 family protein [Pseudomonadota bacterium]